jgi:hypothetical protein
VLLADVNVLVYAHRQEYEDHEAYASWVREVWVGAGPFAVSELVLSGFVRIVTRRPFDPPTPLESALAFCRALLDHPYAVVVRPGSRHWAIFGELTESTRATGKLVADAYHAALAIEHGCEWVTADADFARFPGLRSSHPLRPRG